MGGFFKQRWCPALWLTGRFCLCFLSTSDAAKSQIIPDGTLPTVVIPNGNISVIEGGTRSGSNLFHSFQQFSIPTNSETFFNNTLDIQNIFSRVTGSNSSKCQKYKFRLGWQLRSNG
jgi:large exoprotein involved in heme utilization and adhesion